MASARRSSHFTLEGEVSRAIQLMDQIKARGQTGERKDAAFERKLHQLQKIMASDIFATVRQVYEKVYESVQINGSPEMKASAAAKATAAILRSAIDSAESTLRLIKLPKSSKDGLGFNIIGGREQGTCILVSRIIPGGIAESQGELRRGDQLLAVNGVSLHGESHSKAVQLLKQTTDEVTLLVSHQPKLLDDIEQRTEYSRVTAKRFN